MKDWQAVVDLHTKLTAYVRKHNLKPTIMLKAGNSVPESMHNRIFSFNAGGGFGTNDNEFLAIGIEESINTETVMVCFLCVPKDFPATHVTQYPETKGVQRPEFTIDELATLLTGLELCVDTDHKPEPEDPSFNPTSTPKRTLH